MIQDPETPLDDVTRALPHAVGSEKSVLCCMLADPGDLIPVAIELGLTPSDFYHPQTQTLCQAILAFYEVAKSPQDIEIVSLVQRLADTGQLTKAGGASEIVNIYSYTVPSERALRYHADIVRQRSIARGIIRSANQAIADIYENPEDPKIAIDELDAALINLREGHSTAGPELVAKDVQQIAKEFVEAVSNATPVRRRGVSTGFENIDELTDGLMPGEMFVLAARPSVGKTALMMNVVEHVAMHEKIPTLVFSLEMPRVAVSRRLVYGRAKFPMRTLGSPTRAQLSDFHRASKELMDAQIWIEDRGNLSIQEIRAISRRHHRKHGIGMIAVDYLQLCRSNSKQATGSREREISEISAGLKSLAKELNVPLLVLSQLNRDVEKRTGADKGRPRLSDLRESGSLEQDADQVGLLWRRDYGLTGDEKENVLGQACLSIAKNRNGATGDCHLKFIEQFCRFEASQPPQQQQQEKAQKIASRHA